MKFITFGSPKIENKEIKKVCSVLKSGWIGSGPIVKRFEKAFSTYKKIKYATAVSSGTSALHLSMLASNIKPGSEVITTAMTFCSTINAIIHAGLKPVLVDIDPLTGNIDPSKIEKAISKKTKAILPVHLAGYPCKMDIINKIAKKFKLRVIEDCAHAIETEFKGKKAGTFGDFGCFSFYVTKNLTTSEGGMLISNKKNESNKAKTLALHGLSNDAWSRFSDSGYKHYKVNEIGFKYNMTDIEAAIGLCQLERIEKNWIKRKKIWEMYYDKLSLSKIELPKFPDKEIKHSYHLFQIRINNKKLKITRDVFLKQMIKNKIGVGVHYISIPEHPYYIKKFKWNKKKLPNASKFGKETVSLPLSAKITENQVKYIVHTIKNLTN